MNQHYFHVILTSFLYLASVCGPTHIKETQVTTEQTNQLWVMCLF